ncbi:MAG: hypothetical protein K2G45_00975 [Lachnospiraceae bacterium]|nr:hypothetical protein [Lachnospiraceae bacterium]
MYDRNAFGNPDGSRTDIEDMMSEFIVFDKRYFSSGVASPDDLKTRVIVGPKGSGKTVYLRRIRANLKLNNSIHVNSIEHELPATDLVVRFGQNFAESNITEKWMYAWKFAILRAVISSILNDEDWNQDVTEKEKNKLLEYEGIIFPKYKVPMPIYSELRNILSHYSTKNTFNEYAERKEWDEIEIIVEKIFKKMPALYYFVDSVDEEFGNAPMYWLRCQKGLFYQVMRLIRKELYGNKLHVVICIRDNVMASICKSEHHTRYINEEHVKILNWDYASIQYFFESKIANMKKCYFINENSEKSVVNWFGITHIHNNYRDIEEPILQYVLRHTRLLPRDIVIMGNSLSEIKQMKTNSPQTDICKMIRKKVAKCAKVFGNELLQICANQINNNEMPKDAAEKEYSEVYTSIQEYKESTSNRMKEVFVDVTSDKLKWNQICELEERAEKLLGENCKMFDVLWQNGGVGYIEEGPNGKEEIFFNDGYPEFLLPKEKSIYILRSCLIDAIGIHNPIWDTNPVLGGTTE